MLQHYLRKIGVEFFRQNHRYRGVYALPHFNLGHDQNCLAGMIDADEGVRRKLAIRVVRQLHRLVDRAHGKMEREQKPASEPIGQQRAA